MPIATTSTHKLAQLSLSAFLGLSALLLHVGAHAASTQTPPEGKGKHQGHAIPQEAITACSQLQEGDSCSFSGRQGETMSGTCATPPPEFSDQGLACRPERPQGQKPGKGDMPPKPDESDDSM